MRLPLLLVALVLAACASDPPAPAGCSPGEQRACLCTAGAGTVGSTQLCGPDRTFGSCDCPDGSAPMDTGTSDVGPAPMDIPDAGTDVAAVDLGADVLAPDLGVDAPTDLGDVWPDDGIPRDGCGDVHDGACYAPTDVQPDLGADGPTCPEHFADCDGNASNGCETNTYNGNIAHCGGCGTACPPPPVGANAVCTAGVCRLSGVVCPAGTGNCDGQDANGCETNTLTAAYSCGPGGAVPSCGHACPTTGGTASCVGGVCSLVCDAGRRDCDGVAANGCEADLRTSGAHCGSCGAACVSGQGCVSGACTLLTCSAGFGDCDANPTNGCETNLYINAANCGLCRQACVGGVSCMLGSCNGPVCAAGRGNCDAIASNGCEVSILASVYHCGGCGFPCAAANGFGACVAGVCTVGSCFVGYGDCNASVADGCETDMRRNSSHCGGCGVVCGPGQFCLEGVCTPDSCTAGFGNCDGLTTNGCETNTRTSAAHCGSCSHACAAGETCVASVCTPPPCTNDAVRCNTAGTSVERCVGGAWTLIRTCTTSGLPAGSSASCIGGACAYCRGVAGAPSCGDATCRTDDDCYREREGRCVEGRCFRRGILPCSGDAGCFPWAVTGVGSYCTFDATDLNGATVRSCTGSIVAGCTSDSMCPRSYRCDLRAGRCVTP
ncbi:MAG: hypothetical protein Q8S73_34495 [Deltaproteobacteria bacterium]|nr:hypothetical protein [Myxococcales bacterium]MDP3219260.1 hypothetical protein [Deltaproteobacteria bacterium]